MKKSEILKKAKTFLSNDFNSIYQTVFDGTERYRFMCFCIDHAAQRYEETVELKRAVTQRMDGAATYEEYLAQQLKFDADCGDVELTEHLAKHGLTPESVQNSRRAFLDDMIVYYEERGE